MLVQGEPSGSQASARRAARRNDDALPVATKQKRCVAPGRQQSSYAGADVQIRVDELREG